ncbi:MAG: InlB B-repeat-containing protein, partial [Paludibacteraceae bacterium]|nr:InlB B-repeat-containing protein [Paludibacteraceae bacterium]
EGKKTMTESTVYTFDKWSPAVAEVTGDATYTAEFTESAREYTITWVNGDETTTAQVAYGVMPTAPEGKKTMTESTIYTFDKWSPAIVEVTGDATYTAEFTESAREYTITWIAGGEQQTVQLPYGMPIVSPVAIGYEVVRTDSIYTLTGWTPALEAMVTGDQTYTALYSQRAREYDVIYMVDGAEYKRVQVAYGTAIPQEAAPEKKGHTFSGWSELPATMPAQDITVTGTFTADMCTITWVIRGEQTEQQLAYGSVLTAPMMIGEQVVTAAGIYTLTAWSPSLPQTVTGSETYWAVFTETVRKYKVTFQYEDGTVILTDSVAYGVVPEFTGATPTKEPDAEFTYTFSGWNPVFEAVIGDQTYTAQFDKQSIVTGMEETEQTIVIENGWIRNTTDSPLYIYSVAGQLVRTVVTEMSMDELGRGTYLLTNGKDTLRFVRP